MKKALKKYFIPHERNNFHPHILHTKRAIFYSLFFLVTKVIVIVFVILLPTSAFVLPDVLAEEQRQIVALTNQARAEKNLPPLVVSTKLDQSAQNKADDMATRQYFAHVKDQKGLSSWLKGANYSYEFAGENLAVGFSTAQGIVRAWKNSPTHYANLIDPDFKDLGVGLSGGVYNGKATVFIAQHLGTPLADKTVARAPAGRSSAVPVPAVRAGVTVPTTTPSSSIIVAGSSTSSSSSVLSAKIEGTREADMPVINIIDPTPVEKYLQAKRVMSPLTSIFNVSQTIYLWAIVFFGLALTLNVVINIRRQHSHVIAQTSALLLLLFVFWKF